MVTIPFKNDLIDDNKFFDNGALSLKGKASCKSGGGNSFTIGANSKFDGSIVFRGKGNRIIIGKDCDFRGDILVKGNNQTVLFGDHSTTVGVYILCQENCNVSIGKWCMFSREIEIRTTDAHSVIDRTTGMRTNLPESVTIGDHVWVGVGAIINKGAVVPSDSIVGARSFVSGKFYEEGVIIAGSPGKVVKTGVTWNRLRKKSYSPEEIDHWKS